MHRKNWEIKVQYFLKLNCISKHHCITKTKMTLFINSLNKLLCPFYMFILGNGIALWTWIQRLSVQFVYLQISVPKQYSPFPHPCFSERLYPLPCTSHESYRLDNFLTFQCPDNNPQGAPIILEISMVDIEKVKYNKDFLLSLNYFFSRELLGFI